MCAGGAPYFAPDIMPMKTFTISGSNMPPECRSISASASSELIALLWKAPLSAS